jgi:hypothetical protein
LTINLDKRNKGEEKQKMNRQSLTTFKKPKRRLRQRKADSDVSDSENQQENNYMEDLISRKKRRLERKETNKHLTTVRSSLSKKSILLFN